MRDTLLASTTSTRSMAYRQISKNAIAIVGATKEDLKAAGMETANPLALQARKKKEAGLGGLTTIEMQQITAGQIIY